MSDNLLSYRFVSPNKKLFPQIISVNCKLSIGKATAVGRGDSWSSQISKEKAFGEGIERFSLNDNLPIFSALKCPNTSNGIAFQYTIDKAQANSFNEIIERESVINAWSQDHPVHAFDESDLGQFTRDNKNFRKVLEIAVRDHGLSFHLLYFGQFKNIHTVGVCFQSTFHPYTTFGYSSNESLAFAFEKAFIECCIIYERYKMYSNKIINLQEKNKSLENILYYAENKKTLKEIFPGLICKNDIIFFESKVSSSGFVKLIFDLKNIGLPGFIVRTLNRHFFDFSAGGIKSSYGSRKLGEVHPIG